MFKSKAYERIYITLNFEKNEWRQGITLTLFLAFPQQEDPYNVRHRKAGIAFQV